MKVLIAVDNKPSSQAIIDAVVKMHWNDGTEIYVTTVLSAHDKSAPEGLEEIEQLAVELHNTLRQCQVYFFKPEGDPKTEILEMAKHIKAELIVLGSNCKNTVERLLIGSVCQAVLNGAHCPVIVAKTPCCLAREASPGFKNILVPVDNSVYSDVALAWLGYFSWPEDCRFIVAAVVEEDTSMDAVKESLQKRAGNLSKLLRTNNVYVDVVVGDARASIIELANKYYADLITIGSHGRSGLKKLILGNVAQSITHEAPCAVAVIRGIAPDDKSWYETGAFEKVKPIPIQSLVQSRNFREDDDLRPGIMPGGMG